MNICTYPNAEINGQITEYRCDECDFRSLNKIDRRSGTEFPRAYLIFDSMIHARTDMRMIRNNLSDNVEFNLSHDTQILRRMIIWTLLRECNLEHSNHRKHHGRKKWWDSFQSLTTSFMWICIRCYSYLLFLSKIVKKFTSHSEFQLQSYFLHDISLISVHQLIWFVFDFIERHPDSKNVWHIELTENE